MPQTTHFISGLPRSGSTLLAAVLRQNPRCAAAMTSPVLGLCLSLIEQMSAPSQFEPFFDNARRLAMLRGVFQSYYADNPGVVFDTNRVWTSRVALLAELFPQCRIICCVRDIGWIIDSVERRLARNPFHRSRIFEDRPAPTVYARTEAMMNAETGFIGVPWGGLREAWFGPLADRLLIVGYDGFVADPGAAMRRLYAALGEPAFRHDFTNLAYDAPDYDAGLAMPGLHHVAPRVTKPDRTPAIPPDLFTKYAASAFWRTHPEGPAAPTIIC